MRLLGRAESEFVRVKDPWIINPPLNDVLSLDEWANDRGLAGNSDALLTTAHAHWLRIGRALQIHLALEHSDFCLSSGCGNQEFCSSRNAANVRRFNRNGPLQRTAVGEIDLAFIQPQARAFRLLRTLLNLQPRQFAHAQFGPIGEANSGAREPQSAQAVAEA